MQLATAAKAGFWIAAATALYFALAPAHETPQVFSSNKVMHFAAFCVLTVMAALAWGLARPLLLAALMSGFGALIEILQGLPIFGRDRSLGDWIADTAAVVVILTIAWAYDRARGRRAVIQRPHSRR